MYLYNLICVKNIRHRENFGNYMQKHSKIMYNQYNSIIIYQLAFITNYVDNIINIITKKMYNMGSS